MKTISAVLISIVTLSLLSEAAIPAPKPYLKSRGAAARCEAIENWYENGDIAAGQRLVDDAYDQRGYTYLYIDRVFKPAIGATFGDLSAKQRNKLAKDAARCNPTRQAVLEPLQFEEEKRPQWIRSDTPYRLDPTAEWTAAIAARNAFDAMTIEERLASKEQHVGQLQRLRGPERPSDLMLGTDDVRRPFVKDVDQFNAVLLVMHQTYRRGRDAARNTFDFNGKPRAAAININRFQELNPNYLEIAQIDALEMVNHGFAKIMDDYISIKDTLFDAGLKDRQAFLVSARQTDYFMRLMQQTVDRLGAAGYAGSHELYLESEEIDSTLEQIVARFEAAKSSTTASIVEGYQRYMPEFIEELYSLETEEQFAEYMVANVDLFVGNSPGNYALRTTSLNEDFWTRKKEIGLSPDRIIHKGWEAQEQAKREAQERAALGVIIILAGTADALMD